MSGGRLETARLTLRAFRTHDIDDVLAYAVDREFGRYVPMPFPYRRTDAEAFVARQLAAETGREPSWAIVIDGRVVGAVQLRVEPEHHRAALGFGLARALWGHGLATEAASAVRDWAFTALPVTRLYAASDARNLAAHRVLEKLGMQREATLRLHRTQRRIQVDEARHALFRIEWAAAQAALTAGGPGRF